MAATKEQTLRATLSGILVDRHTAGPIIDIETVKDDGTPGEPIVLRFVPEMPFKAMAGLIVAGPAEGFPAFLKECILTVDLETLNGLDLTWPGMEKLVERVTELYSGNLNTEPS
jgi:hypothetical protein